MSARPGPSGGYHASGIPTGFDNDSALGSNIPESVGLFRLGLVGLCTDLKQHMVGQLGCVGIEVFLNVIGRNSTRLLPRSSEAGQ